MWTARTSLPKYFYPRPPRGGRQIVSALAFTCNIISIHALREEGDPPCAAGRGSLWNFYPRPPRGGRPIGKKRITAQR